MTVFDPKKNFAISTVVTAPVPALTGTQLQITVSEGGLFPAAGGGAAFNAVVFPANAAPSVSNAEIVRVTNRVGETFTIVRAQEGTQARSIQVGDRIIESPTVKTFTDIEAAINAAGGVVALSAAPILEPGIAGQVRAGRVLLPADFTTLLGLAAPVGLYNLSNANDSSGNARNLAARNGGPSFGSGIMGAATEAAIFTGGDVALYLADTGAGDPFRIPYGSWGCWFRTAKLATAQELISKSDAPGSNGWLIQVTTNNVIQITGSVAGGTGVTQVCDDRYHFVIVTYDGALASVYVDGQLDAASITGPGPITYAGAYPLNVGARAADGATAATGPFFGRIDEAFVTQDVLSLEQVRMLYAAKVAHGFAGVPLGAKLAIRRRRKGGALGVGPFSTQPLHLYDFTGGSLADAGSLALALTNNNAALVGPGADGTQGDAVNFVSASSQSLSATDAGLPALATARSMGVWFKTVSGVGAVALAYGTSAADTAYQITVNSNGTVDVDTFTTSRAASAGAYNDGLWHFAVATYDDAALDGLRSKLYVDGKLVGTGTASISTTLAGANKFRVGSTGVPGSFFNGELAHAFVTGYAMSADEVAKLYAQGVLSLGVAPKNPGAHVEALDATYAYLLLDTIESQNLVDLEVTA